MSANKRKIGKSFLSLCIGIIITFVIMFGLEVVIIAVADVFHIETILNLVGENGRPDDVSGMAAFTILGCAQEAGFILGPLVAVWFCYKKKAESLGLTSLKNGMKELLTGLLIGLFSMSAVFVVLLCAGTIEIISISAITPFIFIMETFIYILVGIAEEVFSRGLFMSVMKETDSSLLVFLIPSVFFGAMHLVNNGVSILSVINLIILGLIFAYAFYKTGNIWTSIGIHITWNFFEGVVYGFYVSGNKDQSLMKLQILKNGILTGGEFGPEGGLAVSVIAIFLLLFLRWFYRKSDYDFMHSEM